MGDLLEHVDSIPRRISSDDFDLFIHIQPHDILQGHFLVRHQSASATRARGDLQINQVNMNWVRPSTTRIGERPLLDCTTFRFSENALVDLGPCDTVDFPFAVGTLELEIILGWSMGWWERNVSQILGKGYGFDVAAASTYNKACATLAMSILLRNSRVWVLTHYLIGRVVVLVSSNLAAVANSDVLPCIGRKVEENLPSLSNRDEKVICLYRV